jgi:hypothetical protein
VPLWIGAAAGGDAYLGVVVGCRPLLDLPGAPVLAVVGPEACEALVLLEELLDDPHPAVTASAAQTVSVQIDLLIGARQP